MLYDIEVTADQLQAAARFAFAGGGPVRLLADDSMLLAGQGDDRAAWDTGGEPSTEEYLAAAPLDPSPRAQARALAEQIAALAGEPAEEGGAHAAAQSALAGMGTELAGLLLAGETAGSPTLSERAGEVGRDLAGQIIDSIGKAVSGFPSPPEQRAAITQLIAAGLLTVAREQS